jgi:hypothetical protein
MDWFISSLLIRLRTMDYGLKKTYPRQCFTLPGIGFFYGKVVKLTLGAVPLAVLLKAVP